VPGIELTPLTEAQRAELAAWVLQQGDSLPQSVRAALSQHDALCDGLLGGRRKLSRVLVELRRALGITESSERRRNPDPLGPLSQGGEPAPKQSKRQRLEFKVERYELLATWHKDLVKKHSQKLKTMKNKLMQMPADPEVAEDEPSEEESAADQAEVLEHMARLQCGGPAQPALQSSNEAFMTGAQVATVEEVLPLSAPEVPECDGAVIDTLTEERERFDFTFTVRRITVQVEKKVVEGRDGERRMVSASTALLGPPRYSVTWGLLAHMTVLVVQYAMPMNRLATLLSTDAKRFTGGGLARLLRYVAQRFSPIYTTLFDSLCDAGILSGDDTSCRVLEVNRSFAAAGDSHDAPEPPWHGYRDTEAARALLQQGDDSLAATLASELGFEHGRRVGNGKKKALHTTTISGRSDPDDPRSLVVFLSDPRLSLTNNFAERMLRLEKLIENSSLFRTSLEGRFALDIMRTVLQTAVAARAPLQHYLLAVLRAPPEEVTANPERFTPLAWAAALHREVGDTGDTTAATLAELSS
jgi:hypothetical protein